MRRLYLFSLDDNIDTSSVCDAAAAYISSSIAQLNKGFQLVKHIKYNASQAAAQGLAFYEGLVADAQELEADAVLGCDLQVSVFVFVSVCVSFGGSSSDKEGP